MNRIRNALADLLDRMSKAVRPQGGGGPKPTQPK